MLVLIFHVDSGYVATSISTSTADRGFPEDCVDTSDENALNCPRRTDQQYDLEVVEYGIEDYVATILA